MVTKMKPKEMPKIGDLNRIRDLFNYQRADIDYLQGHYSELLAKYQNQWVMISKGKVIGTESNPDELVKTLNKTGKKDILVYFLADPDEAMLLIEHL